MEGFLDHYIPMLKLLEMLHKWYSATENPEKVIRVILLGFTKAFDRMDHNLLLSDFQMIDVRPTLIPWLPLYLSQSRFSMVSSV